MSGEGTERLLAFLADASSRDRVPPGGGALLAIGWATVELERAIARLAIDLGTTEAAFELAPGSVALGAHCRVAHGVLPGGVAFAVLEPSTEGRLAEALARWDEGPAAAWYAATGPDTEEETAPTSVPGPFGPERLAAAGPAKRPHRLLVTSGPVTIPE